MTNEPPTCLSPAEIEARLKAAGIQATAQRIAIGQYLLCQADHPSAEAIKLWVDGHFPKISMATVYNTLKVLVEAGLVRELHFDHLPCAVYDSNVDRHFHFLDEGTGKVYDVAPEQVEVRPDLGPGFRISQVEVVIRGRRVPQPGHAG